MLFFYWYEMQEPYVNQSTYSVGDKLSLYRAYVIFRSLGLRHMVVVDEANSVFGIITRKDLMSHSIQERLQRSPGLLGSTPAAQLFL